MLRTAMIALSLALLILFTSCARDNSALITAVEKGDVSTVQSLLTPDADPNAKNKDGMPLLIIAATADYRNEDRSAILRALLGKGADVNAKDKDGNTALLEASFMGRTSDVVALLDNGADVNATNKHGYTALMLALQGIDVAEQKSLLGRRMASKQDYTVVVRSLSANGANVNAKDNNGSTALIRAVQVGDAKITSLLIQNGADVNAKNNKGQTALMYAYAFAYPRLKARSGADPFMMVPMKSADEIEVPSLTQEDKDLLVKLDEIVRFLKEAGAKD